MSFLSLAARLVRASHGVYPDPGPKEKLHRAKYVLRGLLAPKLTASLLDLLEQPELTAHYARFPRLAAKLQWPYVSSTLPMDAALEALRSHYRFFVERLPDQVRARLACGQHFELGAVHFEDTESVKLVLRQSNYEKEGELSVSLLLGETNVMVCTATFTVTQWQDETKEIVLGGLQGHPFPEEKPRIIALTRAMKGMRPKALALFVVQQLALAWGVRSLRAVSNSRHIYSSARKRKELAADYDLFWSESGGELQADGIFNLPVEPPIRDLAEIKPNKRSTYRQRYALLDSLAHEIQQAAR